MKRWENILNKVTLRWSVISNWSGHFFNTRQKHGICVIGSGEASSGNLFTSSLLRKTEISHIHLKKFKYDDGQEIWTGPPKPGDVRRWKNKMSQERIIGRKNKPSNKLMTKNVIVIFSNVKDTKNIEDVFVENIMETHHYSGIKN